MKRCNPYLIQPNVEQRMFAFMESTERIITKPARFHIEFEVTCLILNCTPSDPIVVTEDEISFQ